MMIQKSKPAFFISDPFLNPYFHDAPFLNPWSTIDLVCSAQAHLEQLYQGENMNYLSKKLALILLSMSALLNAFAPPQAKTPADLLVGAAGAGNIKGLNYHIKTQKMSPDTLNTAGRSALGMAAGNAQVESVNFLLNAGADPNIKDTNGLTPLHWAVLILNQNKTQQDYENVVRALLSKGARLDILDNQGLSVLHGAARSGNIGILQLLLNSGAQQFINHEGAQEKGRTPLMEAIRASRDAIIHVDLENKDIANHAEFEKALNDAIAQLKKKEEKKLATVEVIQVIDLLKKYGAKTNLVDALGHTPDYYINEVQLASEQDRINLLRALNAPITPRIIENQLADLPNAIARIENLRTMLPSPALAQKIQMLIWTIQAAQREPDKTRQYDILRIAMALIAKIKEIIKDTVKDKALFTDIENALNQIRTILRDSALVVSGKVAAPAVPQPKPVLKPLAKPAPAQPQPLLKPLAKPAPARIPTTPQPAAPIRNVPVLTLIDNRTNSMVIAHIGNTVQIQPGKSLALASLPLDDQYFIFEVGVSDTITWQINNGNSTITQPNGSTIQQQLAPGGRYHLTITPNNTAQLIAIP